MKSLSNIVSFLDDYLRINEITDESWNGLQFEGKEKVNKILFAVDAGSETFKKAIIENADMIVVHHGHFWKNTNPSLVNWTKQRIDLLYINNISLYGVHLPLDRHPIVGNNAQLLKILDAEITEEFLLHEGKNIGWIGKTKPTKLSEIEKKLNDKLNTKCKTLSYGKEKIEKIAVCSGGGGYSAFYEALKKNVDLYISGDSVEVFHSAKDSHTNIIFAGHHASETVGVKALSEVVNKELKVETLFVDLPTGF